jgi:hypothetical protein
MGYYDGVGFGTRGNHYLNNVSFDCDWDHYGLGTDGWTLPEASTGDVVLSATHGTAVTLIGGGQFPLVRWGVGGRNFFVRERADLQGERGLAVVSMKRSDDEIQVHVLRPFSSLRFATGELLIGAMEPYLALGRERNARCAARVGSLKEIPLGVDDVVLYPQLDADLVPYVSSPLRGAGVPHPAALLVPITDKSGRPFGRTPTIGAFEPSA